MLCVVRYGLSLGHQLHCPSPETDTCCVLLGTVCQLVTSCTVRLLNVQSPETDTCYVLSGTVCHLATGCTVRLLNVQSPETDTCCVLLGTVCHLATSCSVRLLNVQSPSLLRDKNETYAAGSKSFRPDIQKPRQMENIVRDI